MVVPGFVEADAGGFAAPVTLETIADQAGTEVGFDGLTVFRAAAHDRGAPVLSLPVLGLMAQWPVDCSPGGPA